MPAREQFERLEAAIGRLRGEYCRVVLLALSEKVYRDEIRLQAYVWWRKPT